MKTSKTKIVSGNDSFQNNTTLRLILILSLVISIGVLIGAITYVAYMRDFVSDDVLSIHTIETSVIVTANGVGIDGNRDVLKFGKVPLGGGSTRYLDITSEYDSVVILRVNGDISKFMTVERNNFYMNKSSLESISVTVDIPSDAKLGTYSGFVEVIFLKPTAK
jgi:hypothetical protein